MLKRLNRVRKFVVLSFFVFACCSVLATEHGQEEENSRHVDPGIATLDIRLINDVQLEVKLTISSKDVLKKKYDATLAADRQLLEDASKKLQLGADYIKFAGSSACSLTNVTLNSPLLSYMEGHNHGLGQTNQEHGEFSYFIVTYQYKCTNHEPPRQLQALFFTYYAQLRAIETSWYGQVDRTNKMLTPKDNEIRIPAL